MSDCVRYSDNVSWVQIKREIFVIDELRNRYFIFTKIKRIVWLYIENNLPINDIVYSISKAEDIAEEKVVEILEQMRNNSLVKWGSDNEK